MEQNSDLVQAGNLIHENSYQERSAEMEEVLIDGIKIDYFDKKTNTIHETKKSDKMEDAHILQLKYYIFILKKNGVENVKGKLEYPKLRETRLIELTSEDEIKILEYEKEIKEIINSKNCPEIVKKKFCEKCAYFDFCYVNEFE